MFKLLYYFQLGITALMIYSWGTLFFLPDTARDARWSNKMNTGAVVLVFLVVSGVVSYFQYVGNYRVASIVLYGFYGLVLCWLLWLLKNANWR
ncbi:MAG: hypothetical protein H7246_19250 [Phycisphaerae bacterium]|nr:hypothetical protein [Saprospiraceae bacterium]